MRQPKLSRSGNQPWIARFNDYWHLLGEASSFWLRVLAKHVQELIPVGLLATMGLCLWSGKVMMFTFGFNTSEYQAILPPCTNSGVRS